MKKFLALVLALVMTMSLVTISSSAAKYSDDADVDFDEAVAVMSAVGVFQGADGKFDPKANLTREQAAKLIAYLDLGEKTAEALPAVKVFNDVAADRWSAKYVAYCADAGYLAGVGDNKFDPTGELTGYAFGKLVLCVLGYDAKIEGFTGANWSIAVAKLMQANNITKGVDASASAVLTRETAAQYCLNALKATCVEYATKGTAVTINGVEIVTGASKATPVYINTETNAGDYARTAGAASIGTKQLCEKLYGDTKALTFAAGADDGFGRTTKIWKYDNKTVATVTSSASLTYSDKKSTSTAANITAVKNDLIGKGVTFTSGTNNFTTPVAAGDIFTNEFAPAGAAITNVEGLMGLTANGKQVEIFIDADNHKISRIAIIEYTVGKVTNIKEGVKNAAGSVYTKYEIKPISDDVTDAFGVAVTKEVFTEAKNDETDTIAVFSGIAKDAIVTYAKDANGKVYVYPTTVVSGTQSAHTSSALTIDGTSYKVALGARDNDNNVAIGSFPNGNKAANYYLDQFGFVVKTNAVSSAKEYCVLVDVAALAGVGASTEARLVFPDASSKIVTLDKLYVDGDTDVTALSDVTADPASYINAIYSYTVNDDGSYVLKEAVLDGEGADTKGTSGNSTIATFMTRNIPSVSGLFTVNAKTVVVVDTKDSSTGKTVHTAYTGYAAMPTITLAGTDKVYYDFVKDSNGAVTFAYVNASALADDDSGVADESATAAYVYVIEADTKTVMIGTRDYNVSKVDNYDGATEITTSDPVAATGLYKVSSVNDKGVVTLAVSTPKFTQLTVSADAAGGILKLSDGRDYTFNGEEKVIVIAADGTVSDGAAGSVIKDDTASVYVSVKTGAAAGTYPIDTMYVVMK